MIVNPRVADYINSLDAGPFALWDRDPVQERLYGQITEEAEASFVPIIRKETAALLQTLVAAKRPSRILEVGTAVGCSALLMSQVMPQGCHIVTVENHAPRIESARRNFQKAGKDDVITLLEGDAKEVLTQLEGDYGFIFMDAAKGQYLSWLPTVLRRLAPGGMLVTDNVLQDGDIVEPRYAVERRNRTIHARMRRYLYELKHSSQLQTAIVPIGDGVAISVKADVEKEGNDG